MLSEALTQLPYCFIFREPRFEENRFAIKPGDAERFAEYGIDIRSFRRRWSRHRRKSFVEAFKNELIPLLSSCLMQVGVKEIRHENWKEYFRCFPDMRILMTGRDPRDIYISLYYRVINAKGRWSGAYSPAAVAKDLNSQFQNQLRMAEATKYLKVKYEELSEDELNSEND